MKRIHVDEDIKPVSEFRANAATLIGQIRKTRRPLVLTQRGRGAAVVVSVVEYEKMVEELELLRDIHVAEGQISRGEKVPHEDARALVLSKVRKK